MPFHYKKNFLGPLLVALAAALWATDALFRVPTLQKIDASLIVALEHLVVFLLFLPYVWFKREEFFKLKFYDWIGLMVIGSGASAIALLLFTKSFQLINPSVTILIQKIQPILTTLLALIFLQEIPSRVFLIAAPIAIASAAVLSFPELNFPSFSEELDANSKGVLFALTAACLWAVATVIGKSVLKRVSPIVTTFWRYWFGLITLIPFVFLSPTNHSLELLSEISTVQAILFIAIIPGLLAMTLYNYGVKYTQANITAFAEMIFPVTAVILNWVYLKAQLNYVQLGAGAALVLSIAFIFAKGDRPTEEVPLPEDPEDYFPPVEKDFQPNQSSEEKDQTES